ncbi:MAG TPA: ATP-dependent 6-phosphofructokinase, partial [Clostridiales bacterium]|nr:ATP-dependent 6-phosphofructokinase [Clostridiales bacterium]
MGNIRTIGVLTSGGDAPGMNAAIRAVVRAGIYYGYKVLGIKRGFSGLISGDVEELTPRNVSGIIQHGGTFLKTSRSPE